MTTFVLILTLVTGYGGAINSVTGFESDAACQAAGQVWVQSTTAKGGMGSKISFVCIGQTKN